VRSGNGGVEAKVEVCGRGHVQCFYVPAGKRRKGKCPACASPTMADCPSCGAPVGRRVGCELWPYVWERDLRIPQHCTGCGRDLPWAMGGCRAAETAVAARARRRLKHRAARVARTASGFTAGLAAAMCVLAGRASGPAAGMEADGDGRYRIMAGQPDPLAYVMPMGSGWVCDCPDFEGGVARCGHAWTAAFLERARPLARRLGLPGEIRGPGRKKTETAAAVELAVGGAASDPARLEEAALARISSAWKGYLEWERFSNRDMELSIGLAGEDPGRAMHHAQQAMEKQIKALRLYCAAFDDNFSVRELKHDLFVKKSDRKFKMLLNKFGTELKELTMGISKEQSKHRVVGYMGSMPSLVAYGIDIDEASAPLEFENLTLEGHYRYLQKSLSPMLYRPLELRCPTREYVSVAQWGSLDYRGGAEGLAAQWDVGTAKILNEFLSGAWKWRYYALYVHRDARYPSEFDPVYARHADTVKKWVFEAGLMTAHMQNQVRSYYTIHTYREGDYLNRRIGPVRDDSWYDDQLEAARTSARKGG